jgi:hypothetical protein
MCNLKLLSPMCFFLLRVIFVSHEVTSEGSLNLKTSLFKNKTPAGLCLLSHGSGVCIVLSII